MIPAKMFFTSGVGTNKIPLTSFECALRDAKIERYNLVAVSSILPPNCKIIPRNEGIKYLSPGEVVYTVIARLDSNEPHRRISTAIGCAVPADRSTYGYLSERHCFGESRKVVGDTAEDIAATMLATTLGIDDFNSETDYSQRKEVYMMSGKIVKSYSIPRTAEVNEHGDWTTVLSAAVFIPPDAVKRFDAKRLDDVIAQA